MKVTIDLASYNEAMQIVERVRILERLCIQVAKDNVVLPEEEQMCSIPMRDIAVIMGWEYGINDESRNKYGTAS